MQRAGIGPSLSAAEASPPAPGQEGYGWIVTFNGGVVEVSGGSTASNAISLYGDLPPLTVASDSGGSIAVVQAVDGVKPINAHSTTALANGLRPYTE